MMTKKIKLYLPNADVTIKDSEDTIILKFVDGRVAKIEGNSDDKDRYISDWTTSSDRCYMRGIQDKLYTNKDFIEYVYNNWVESCYDKIENAKEVLKFFSKYEA